MTSLKVIGSRRHRVSRAGNEPRAGRLIRRAAVAVSAVLLALLGANMLWPAARERVRMDARTAIRGVTATIGANDSEMSGDGDGYIAVGASVSPFGDRPAVEKLDPALRSAVRQAAVAARADGVTLRVNSGWRSERYQRTLFRRAVVTYGSVDVARRYVKPPGESDHVTGRAVDVGPADADSWLSQHGSEYGLCQTYANERWHFERVTEPGGICPEMKRDAAGAG